MMKTLAVWLALTCLVASGLCDASPEETKALEGEAHVRSRRGMVSPIFIPVLIPFGIGRPGYQAGMQCFACEGRDQELCVVNPAASSRLVTCQPNQYCSVVRKEFTPNTTAMSDANAGRGYVFISRGCRPADYVQVMAYDEKSGVYNTKSYIQFCASDFCNSGDGRLKCYECEGTGNQHPCMVSPASTGRMITCLPDHYCSIVRTTKAGPNNGPAVMSISRGCKSQAVLGSGNKNDDSVLALACSSDLCNNIDGNQLSRARPLFGVPVVTSCAGLAILAAFIAFQQFCY